MMTMYISPYRRLATLREAMDRLLEENLSEKSTNEREMLLPVDVRSQEDAFEIIALVPGLEAEDLSIEILKDTVTIRGDFKSFDNDQANFVVCELPEGHFSRVITLPVAVDSTKAEASIKNGVLNLRVPKAEAHRPKTIAVKTA